MKRPLLTLLLALGAVALMAPRPSINELNTRVNQLEADQTRQDDEIRFTQDATCAASDVRGDTYRPAFCPARCTVSPPSSLDPAIDSCKSDSSGFQVVRQAFAGGACVGGVCGYDPVSTGPCQTDADCPGTSVCNPLGVFPGECFIVTTSCSADSDCPVFAVEETLYECASVGAPGALPAATCDGGNGSEPLNSSDALACRADVETQVGACQ